MSSESKSTAGSKTQTKVENEAASKSFKNMSPFAKITFIAISVYGIVTLVITGLSLNTTPNCFNRGKAYNGEQIITCCKMTPSENPKNRRLSNNFGYYTPYYFENHRYFYDYSYRYYTIGSCDWYCESQSDDSGYCNSPGACDTYSWNYYVTALTTTVVANVKALWKGFSGIDVDDKYKWPSRFVSFVLILVSAVFAGLQLSEFSDCVDAGFTGNLAIVFAIEMVHKVMDFVQDNIIEKFSSLFGEKAEVVQRLAELATMGADASGASNIVPTNTVSAMHGAV